MRSMDVLDDALMYALDQIGGAVPPVAVVNATGFEDESFVKQSGNACYKLENTLSGVFGTVLVRATRQKEETLGLVAMAQGHADPRGRIVIAQENAHGASGLEKHLRRAYPNLQTIVKFKCRIMVLDAAEANDKQLLHWTTEAAVKKVHGDFWSAPGIFSWNRADPASRLLLSHLPSSLPGKIGDLGCGNGFLTASLARKEGVTEIWALDCDAQAVACCRLNLEDRAVTVPFHVLWRDATQPQGDIPPLDVVVMNPPFHTQQDEDRQLGQKFCEAALRMLKSGGELYLVANRHMPYEAILEKDAMAVTLLADLDGFKIIRARAR